VKTKDKRGKRKKETKNGKKHKNTKQKSKRTRHNNLWGAKRTNLSGKKRKKKERYITESYHSDGRPGCMEKQELGGV